MNVPAIGGARGIFEIFVPGMFLLANFVGFAYLLPTADDSLRHMIADATSNVSLSLMLAICFGYLIGVILRLARAEIPDRLSVCWMRAFPWLCCRLEDRQIVADHLKESFPYFPWLRNVSATYFPRALYFFYVKVWNAMSTPGGNMKFFNFCKIVVNANDQDSTREINASEAMVRYVAGMFYAVGISLLLGLALIVLRPDLWPYLLAAILGYAMTIGVILSRYRHIRMIEAEVVLIATFINRKHFRCLGGPWARPYSGQPANPAAYPPSAQGTGTGMQSPPLMAKDPPHTIIWPRCSSSTNRW